MFSIPPLVLEEAVSCDSPKEHFCVIQDRPTRLNSCDQLYFLVSDVFKKSRVSNIRIRPLKEKSSKIKITDRRALAKYYK